MTTQDRGFYEPKRCPWCRGYTGMDTSPWCSHCGRHEAAGSAGRAQAQRGEGGSVPPPLRASVDRFEDLIVAMLIVAYAALPLLAVAFAATGLAILIAVGLCLGGLDCPLPLTETGCSPSPS